MRYTSEQIDAFREFARKCFSTPTIHIDEKGMIAYWPFNVYFRKRWEPDIEISETVQETRQ